MDFDILDALDDLGYSGILKNDEEIREAIEKGTESLEFTQLVEWLSKELQALNNMESCINAITDVKDSSSFLLEVSSFLKELHCPYESLITGPISQRLSDVQSRRTFLDFLCTELFAARLLYSKKEVKNTMEIQLDASSTALSLQNALNALNISIDNASSDSIACLTEIENEVTQKLDSSDISPPILTETLSEDHWESLSSLYEDFVAEYTVRRKLLLTRLEVTVQSFKWGEGSKGKENKILNAYLPHRKHLKDQPAVKLSDAIAARESLLIIEKTSSANLVKNTKSSVNRVVISGVPDRGGRPKEQRPPVEMPNWSKRSQGGGQGDHRRGRGGGQWRGKGKKFRS